MQKDKKCRPNFRSWNIGQRLHKFYSSNNINRDIPLLLWVTYLYWCCKKIARTSLEHRSLITRTGRHMVGVVRGREAKCIFYPFSQSPKTVIIGLWLNAYTQEQQSTDIILIFIGCQTNRAGLNSRIKGGLISPSLIFVKQPY